MLNFHWWVVPERACTRGQDALVLRSRLQRVLGCASLASRQVTSLGVPRGSRGSFRHFPMTFYFKSPSTLKFQKRFLCRNFLAWDVHDDTKEIVFLQHDAKGNMFYLLTSSPIFSREEVLILARWAVSLKDTFWLKYVPCPYSCHSIWRCHIYLDVLPWYRLYRYHGLLICL